MWRRANRLAKGDDYQLDHEDDLGFNVDHVVADDDDNLLYRGKGRLWQKEHTMLEICTEQNLCCFEEGNFSM